MKRYMRAGVVLANDIYSPEFYWQHKYPSELEALKP